jgi:hypothetical protein
MGFWKESASWQHEIAAGATIEAVVGMRAAPTLVGRVDVERARRVARVVAHGRTRAVRVRARIRARGGPPRQAERAASARMRRRRAAAAAPGLAGSAARARMHRAALVRSRARARRRATPRREHRAPAAIRSGSFVRLAKKVKRAAPREGISANHSSRVDHTQRRATAPA